LGLIPQSNQVGPCSNFYFFRSTTFFLSSPRSTVPEVGQVTYFLT